MRLGWIVGVVSEAGVESHKHLLDIQEEIPCLPYDISTHMTVLPLLPAFFKKNTATDPATPTTTPPKKDKTICPGLEGGGSERHRRDPHETVS